MVALGDPGVLDDAGDVLRRDGVCEQRGRGRRDDGRWDDARRGLRGVRAARRCTGARRCSTRAASTSASSPTSRTSTSALRLRLAGWRCAYEPRAVARHAGGGSSERLARPVGRWAARNTLLLRAQGTSRRAGCRCVALPPAVVARTRRRGAARLRAHLRGLLRGAAAAAGDAARARRLAHEAGARSRTPCRGGRGAARGPAGTRGPGSDAAGALARALGDGSSLCGVHDPAGRSSRTTRG